MPAIIASILPDSSFHASGTTMYAALYLPLPHRLPDNTPPNYGEDDYTPLPMPTNVRCQAIAPNKIMVIFDPPNYGNHAHAEIYYIPEAAGQTYAQFIAALAR